ncbi:MAG: hypothetical protein KJ063_14110 [Anaerolineae bacterium]|nr:hypothetical protein [Anaerolineae bacterium]
MFITTATMIFLLLGAYLLGVITVPILFLLLITSRGRLAATPSSRQS